MPDVTIFAGARSATPHAVESWAWGDFAAEIEALCREESTATDKRDLPAFGAYLLRDGATRSAANIERMAAMAALDCDGVELDALRARLRELGVRAIVHGSPSDDANASKRKARVYVELDAEHAPSDAGRVRESVAALLGVEHDPACSNADRIMFCGRLHGTPPRFVERFEGKPLALATLPAAPPAAARVAVAAPAAPAAQSAARVRAFGAMLAALGDAHDHDGAKHHACVAIGGVMRKAQCWAREEVELIVRAWLPANDPAVNVNAGVRAALRAFELEAADVSGGGKLASIIGERASALFQLASLMPAPGADARSDAAIDDTPSAAYATLPFQALDLVQPPLEYVIPALELAPGKCSALQGYAYTSKTPFAIAEGLCIAAGIDFLGMPVEQGAVAYLDSEPSRLTWDRIKRIRLGLGLGTDVPFHYAQTDVLSEAMFDDIARAIADLNLRVVIVDTYSSAIPAERGFNDSTFRVWADALGRLSARTNVLMQILLHEGKADKGDDLRGISGHGSLAGALQTAIRLSRPSDTDRNTIEVSSVRATRAGFDAFAIKWSERPCDDAPEGTTLHVERIGGERAARASGGERAPRSGGSDRAHAIRLAGERVMRALSHVHTSRALAIAQSGGNANAAKEAIARLVDAGLIVECAGSICKSDAGVVAGSTAIAAALGATAGFQR